MTCIAAWINSKGDVTMGCDSLGSNGHRSEARKDCKVFRIGEFLIGYTSSYRMGQLLQFSDHCCGLDSLSPPSDDRELMRFMVCDFTDRCRDILSHGGFMEKSNNVEKGGIFLVAVRGRLFRIESDFQVAETSRHYDACGSGDMVALGALHALSATTGVTHVMQQHDVDYYIRQALIAASDHVCGVSGPFHIETLNAPTRHEQSSQA